MDDGRVVVIAGAARGIGLAASRRLVQNGCIVVGIDRDQDALQTAMASLSGEGSTQAICVDLTDRMALDAAVSQVKETHGRIDALVNCAGITGNTGLPAHEVDPEDFDRVYRINLFAAMLLTRAVIPTMLEAGSGRILHVTSIAGKEGNAGMVAYSATKAGLIGLVKSSAKDYAESGITINALAPAVIRTDMVAAMPEAQVRYMTDRIPMKRTGKLEEAAAMIEFIISPDCAFTTGFTFDLSGGRATY